MELEKKNGLEEKLIDFAMQNEALKLKEEKIMKEIDRNKQKNLTLNNTISNMQS